MINANMLDSRVLNLLLKAGWTEDRYVDTTQWTVPLIEEGFKIVPLALRVLANCGGLDIRFRKESTYEYVERIWIEPFYAAGESDRALEWERQTGLVLFPIGMQQSTAHIIWTADDNRVYSGHGFGLYSVADTWEEAMLELTFPTRPYRQIAD